MTRTLLASLLLSSSLLGACGDDGGPAEYDARFSGADDQHVVRAIIAGAGVDTFVIVLSAGAYAAMAEDPEGAASCPSIEVDGDRVIARGGCTMDDGGRVDGTMTLENVAPLFSGETFAKDPSQPAIVTMDGYRVTDAEGDAWSLDGTLRAEGDERLTLELESEIDGILARISATYVEADDGGTTVEAGAWVDVDGVGAAELSGTWTLDEPPTGSLTLRGAETLVVDFARATDDCVRFAVDGDDREICGLDGGE